MGRAGAAAAPGSPGAHGLAAPRLATQAEPTSESSRPCPSRKSCRLCCAKGSKSIPKAYGKVIVLLKVACRTGSDGRASCFPVEAPEERAVRLLLDAGARHHPPAADHPHRLGRHTCACCCRVSGHARPYACVVPPLLPRHCKKAQPASGPAIGKTCCVVRAAPATPPAEPHARQAPGPEAAIAERPAVFHAGVTRFIPRELPRLAASPPPLQINRPLLR